MIKTAIFLCLVIPISISDDTARLQMFTGYNCTGSKREVACNDKSCVDLKGITYLSFKVTNFNDYYSQGRINFYGENNCNDYDNSPFGQCDNDRCYQGKHNKLDHSLTCELVPTGGSTTSAPAMLSILLTVALFLKRFD
ncbi:hypothetical protein M3Y97_00954700 [Aphelenchoides bicaudatus]|nr:hypothetical protein M3Y97_00954700 [Aphelenchoides bicaudatus]